MCNGLFLKKLSNKCRKHKTKQTMKMLFRDKHAIKSKKKRKRTLFTDNKRNTSNYIDYLIIKM